MPNSEAILELAQTVVRELNYYGRGAQFIAYVKTAPHDGIEHVFVMRDSVLPERRESARNVIYARYRLPLGKIAEADPGQVATVRVAEVVGSRPTGHYHQSNYQILARDKFHLRWSEGVADAVENDLAFPGESFYLPTLRDWIVRTLDEIALEAAKPRRRRMAERLELADTPVVDSYQGEVWRTNIRRFLVITGAPGTGKTTTAIKRLAQKTDVTTLRYEVPDVSEDRLRQCLEGAKSWVLFTPSELLRNYLHQALAEEQLAATVDRVPLWSDTKKRIGRDALRLFGQDRHFSLATDLVEIRDSMSLSRWTIGFREHFTKRIHEELRRATAETSGFIDDTREACESRITALHAQAAPLRDQRRSLEEELLQSENEQARDAANRKLRDVESHLSPVTAQLNTLESAIRIWNEVRALGMVADAAPLGRTLSGALSARTNLNQFVQRLKNLETPETDSARINTLITAARDVLTLVSDESVESLDSVLRKLPIVYHEYRLHASEGERFYRNAALADVNNRRLDPMELDSLIYVALHLMREVFANELPQRIGNSITYRLAAEFRYVVAVDEATDFSAVELACMRLLAHPMFDCVTFAGDPMQRMTAYGIRDWEEISALVEAPEVHELRYSYRQSKKLLTIAARLFEKTIGRPAPFEAGFRDSPEDPDALRHQSSPSSNEAGWLAERIGEIYRVCGERLPSIAVLVPGERDIQPLATLLKVHLQSYGIEPEDCPQGRILGTQAKVRVFSVQYIKGLEFEAVFFAGVDRMAALSPDLIARFLYVGLTRARSFLAVTHEGDFPVELAHVADLFKVGAWRHLIPTAEQ